MNESYLYDITNDEFMEISKEFNKDFKKLGNYLKKIHTKGATLASEVWEAVKIEGQETKICVEIISKMIKEEPVTENEKEFLKAQSLDLARILPLIAIQGIPIPVPITPFLIILGRKYGFDVLPKDNRDLLIGGDKKDFFNK